MFSPSLLFDNTHTHTDTADLKYGKLSPQNEKKNNLSINLPNEMKRIYHALCARYIRKKTA